MLTTHYVNYPYLITAKDVGIENKGISELFCYLDSGYASDTQSRKSITGHIFLMNNGPITKVDM